MKTLIGYERGFCQGTSQSPAGCVALIRCTVGSTTHMREGLMIFDETWLLSFE